MLSATTLLKHNQKLTEKDLAIDNKGYTSYEKYKDACRKYLLSKITNEYITMDAQSKKNFDETQITDYVHRNSFPVEGFVNDDNSMNFAELIEALIRDLTDYGILTPFLNDPTVTEIQINELDAIFVERNGKTALVVDDNGNNLRFESQDQLLTLINRLINNDGEENKKISETNALVNAVSQQGYRISVTDKSVSPPGVSPYKNRSYSVAIRKPNPTRFTYEELVENGTLTDECARFLRVVNESGCNYFTVGPTGSGKTSLISTMAENTPHTTRVLVIQSPSELDMTVYDENDNIINNVVHWEARDIPRGLDKANSGYPSVGNCISHSLRFTPHKVIVGEVRRPEEFFELIREGLTGHIIVSSFHAHDSKQAIERAVAEIAPSVGDIELSYRYICSNMHFIVVQKRLQDGTRRILEVAEVTGYDPLKRQPMINLIFKFTPTGVVEYEDGTTDYKIGKKIKYIHGGLKRVGSISSDRLREMLLEGIALEQIQEFVNDEDIKKVVSGQ